MGVYGSPQLGAYAEKNNKRRHSKKPWFIIFFIICIVSINYIYQNEEELMKTALVKLYNTLPRHEVETIAYIPEETITSISKETKRPIEIEPKKLDYTTGIYFKNNSEINSEITNMINEILMKIKYKQLNIIEEKNRLNEIYKLLETQKKQDIKSDFKEHQEQSIQTYEVTLKLIAYRMDNDSLNQETVTSLSIDYSKSIKELYRLTKKLFDENNIWYEETVNANGTTFINFKYEVRY